MVFLQICLTLLLLSGATFVAAVQVSEIVYKDKPDPDWLKVTGGLALGLTFVSLVASLITTVWVAL